MYGTVSEICIELLKKHENNEKLAIIVWSVEDVRETGAEFAPTKDDVHHVLRVIGKAGSAGAWRHGLGLEFVFDEMSKIATDRASRQIAIPENELRALLPAISAGLDSIDDESGAAKAALDTLQLVLDSPSA